MLLELALIVIVLYVLYIQHTMHQQPDGSSEYNSNEIFSVENCKFIFN